jgi:hypothetical protein
LTPEGRRFRVGGGVDGSAASGIAAPHVIPDGLSLAAVSTSQVHSQSPSLSNPIPLAFLYLFYLPRIASPRRRSQPSSPPAGGAPARWSLNWQTTVGYRTAHYSTRTTLRQNRLYPRSPIIEHQPPRQLQQQVREVAQLRREAHACGALRVNAARPYVVDAATRWSQRAICSRSSSEPCTLWLP